MTGSRIAYPWLSIFTALLVIAWQFILLVPEFILPYRLPDPLLQEQSLLAAIAITLLLVIFDIHRFFKSWSRYRAQLARHEDQIAELFDSRRQLGARVRTYSDHADKLKLFISDRLLEYIEYDEKFLHFKNIASEVRHNGVISYDRAQTALKTAASMCADRIEGNDGTSQFEEASESLLYLWDLLDIATTDNITLHVANRIYDSEEYYFQSMLKDQAPSAFPYSPTFSIYSALIKALLPILDSPAQLDETQSPGFPYRYCDERFHLLVNNDSDMLGNQNHIVLLIENLLNNAVYYADQNTAQNKYSRVAIWLRREQDQILLTIYNRGPKIRDEDRNKIFQLGYSSRRVRDHHGKGLGLYFVNEICKGFEGSVDFENIENLESGLSLRIEQLSGEVETHFIAVVEDNGKPLCHIAQSEEAPKRSLSWSFSSPIASIEVSSQATAEPQVITSVEQEENFNHLDASDTLLPRWVLEITNRKRSSKMVFKPLDVRGVRFTVKLPTAVSRLENQDLEAEA